MNVTIKDSVRQAGLEEAVRKVSDLFPQVVSKPLQPQVDVAWDVLKDAYGSQWVLVTLDYAQRAREREVFEPAALGDEPFVRQRFEWLWDRVVQASLIKRLGEPLGGPADIEEPVVQTSNG